MTIVEYQLLLKDKFSAGIERADNKTEKFNRTLKETNANSKGLGSSLASFGKMAGAAAFLGITYGAGKLSSSIVKLGADMEQTKVSFSVMLGSMDKANKMVDDINDFANVTPFENDTLFETTKLLLNYGIAQDDIMPTLQKLGDVSGGSAEKMNRLALAFGQASSLGKLQGQDMKQMIEVGFNPLLEMSRTSGKSMEELTKMMGKGQISTKMLNDAFTSATSKGGKFFGMMQKQSQTLAGRWSTLMGKLKMIGIKVGTGLLPILGGFVDKIVSVIDKIAPKIQPLIDKYLPVMTRFLTDAFTRLKTLGSALYNIFNIVYNAISPLIPKIKEIIQSIISIGTRFADTIGQSKIFKAVIEGLGIALQIIINSIALIIKGFDQLWAKMDARSENKKRMDDWDKNYYANLEKEKAANKAKYDGLQRQIDYYEEIKEKIETIGVLNKDTGKEFLSQLTMAQRQVAAGFLRDENKNKLKELAEKLKFKKKITPILGGGGMSNQITEVNKITGSAPKIFNLNITKLVENFTVSTTSLKEGANDIRNMVLETLQEALVDIQTNVR